VQRDVHDEVDVPGGSLCVVVERARKGVAEGSEEAGRGYRGVAQPRKGGFVRRISLNTVPKHDAPRPGLPFPGRWPTRWCLKFQSVGIDWTYLGKPSRGALSKLIKMLKNTKRGPVVLDIREFDRSGALFRKLYAGDVVRDPITWLEKGHCTSIWLTYHAWDQRNLLWILQPHKTVKLQTAAGLRRFYLPTAVEGGDWKSEYRTLQRLNMDGEANGGLI